MSSRIVLVNKGLKALEMLSTLVEDPGLCFILFVDGIRSCTWLGLVDHRTPAFSIVSGGFSLTEIARHQNPTIESPLKHVHQQKCHRTRNRDKQIS